MLALAKTHDFVTVVNDQIGSPTYADDLAKLLYQLIHTEKYGTYHITNEGFCSWAELARKVFELKNMKVEVIPVSSEEYGSPAKRPKNSRLSKKSLTDNGFSLLPTWKSSLKNFLKM